MTQVPPSCTCLDPRLCCCGTSQPSQSTCPQRMFSVQPQLATPSMGPYVHSPWGYQTHVNFSNPLPPTAYVSNFPNVYSTTYSPQNNPYPGEPLPFRSALSDATYNTLNRVNTTTATGNASGKRKNTSKGTTGSKRRNLGSDANAPTSQTPISTSSLGVPSNHPAVPGVGPQVINLNSQANPSLHPAFTRMNSITNSLGSLLKNKSDNNLTHATDVWYFTRGLTAPEKPQTMPEQEVLSEKRPDTKAFAYLGCRLCSFEISWTTWKNVEGQTASIRQHLRGKHGKVWRDVVVLRQLKGWKEIGALTVEEEPLEREPFSLTGFYERLVRWVAVDDQSIDVIDSPELRELLLYISPHLDKVDIPHRTKLSELITMGFKREYFAMLKDIENSLGRVSFTSDIWSRQNLESYMAITAHYSAKSTKSGNIIIRTQLVAFRQLQGSHSGVNIGKVFLQVIKEIGCLNKLSMITLDNASNNNTLMEELSTELEKLGIPFDKDGNRIRCFPHVINIAVKAALKHLTEPPSFFSDVDRETDLEFMELESFEDTDPDYSAAFKNNDAYQAALKSDVVARVRRYVTACRASGQRREEFNTILIEGNKAEGWGESHEPIREVGLLKDVDTRWSSTFRMIDRFLETYLVSEKLVQHNIELSHHTFTAIDIQVLSDIREFLYVFHVVQELVSAEKTPTLSIVLPMYEKLIIMLSDLKNKTPELSHAISASISKLEEYLAKSRKSKIYSLAIVLNPTVKFQWLKDNWTESEYNNTRATVSQVLLEYQRELRNTMARTTLTPTATTSVSRRIVRAPSASHAALSQASGYARFNQLARSLSAPTLPSSSSTQEDTADQVRDPEEQERRAVEEDRKVVEAAILAYEAEGILDENHPESKDFDLLRYWQSKQAIYPLLWKVALDVLPAQASAVPCERIFSSSKETDSLRRANMSSWKMEELQFLKFGYRSDRLTFTEHLISTERELSVLDLSISVVDDLMSRGKLDELEKYIDESWVGWGGERA